MPKIDRRIEYEIQARNNGGLAWAAVKQAVDLGSARYELESFIREKNLPRERLRVVKRTIDEEVVIWMGAD